MTPRDQFPDDHKRDRGENLRGSFSKRIFHRRRSGRTTRASYTQLNEKNSVHHEGTKDTKEEFSRKSAKHALSRVEGDARCHFDRREKSFSDPSHSLGITDRGPSPLRAWRLGGRKSEAPVVQGAQTGKKFAQAAKSFKNSNTKDTTGSDFLEYKLRALRGLRGEICIFFSIAPLPRCACYVLYQIAGKVVAEILTTEFFPLRAVVPLAGKVVRRSFASCRETY